MKKTERFTVEQVEANSLIGSTRFYLLPVVRNGNYPKAGMVIEISWDEPEPKPKHDCGRILPPYMIFYNGGWQMAIYDVRFAYGRNIAYIFNCPFCGEKLA